MAFAIFPAIQLKIYWRNNKYWRLLKNRNDLIQIPIDFCEQAKNIRGPREIIYNYLRPSKRLLPR
jgi:hypothetical protein